MCLTTVAVGLTRVNHIHCPSTPFSVILSFLSLPTTPPQAAKNSHSSREAALETTELMELLVQEPNANTAIKCPTDPSAVQTLPSTAAHRHVDANIQHTSVVDGCIQVSLVQCQTINESERTGKCNHPPGDSRAALDFKKCRQDGKSFSPWPGFCDCKAYSISWHAPKSNLNPLS